MTRGDEAFCRVFPGWVAICVAGLWMCGCGGSGSQTVATTTTTTTTTPPGTGNVTISGTRLMRDGAAWTPKALQLNAFVAAPSVAAGVYLAAYQHYSAAELVALKGWGADTVRFQIGQPEVDPQSSLYSAAFVTQVQVAVAQARADGLNVILSMQDQAQTGETAPARTAECEHDAGLGNAGDDGEQRPGHPVRVVQ